MDYLERLNKSIESLENNADKLSRISELLTNNSGLTEEVQNEKKAILDSQNEIEVVIEEIKKETKDVQELISNNEKHFEELNTVVKEKLLHNKKETLEVVESISTTISNKLTVTQSNIEATITSKLNAVEDDLNNTIEKKATETYEELKKLDNKILDCNNQILNLHNTINQIRIISIVSLVLIGIGIGIGYIF